MRDPDANDENADVVVSIPWTVCLALALFVVGLVVMGATIVSCG